MGPSTALLLLASSAVCRSVTAQTTDADTADDGKSEVMLYVSIFMVVIIAFVCIVCACSIRTRLCRSTDHHDRVAAYSASAEATPHMRKVAKYELARIRSQRALLPHSSTKPVKMVPVMHDDELLRTVSVLTTAPGSTPEDVQLAKAAYAAEYEASHAGRLRVNVHNQGLVDFTKVPGTPALDGTASCALSNRPLDNGNFPTGSAVYFEVTIKSLSRGAAVSVGWASNRIAANMHIGAQPSSMGIISSSGCTRCCGSEPATYIQRALVAGDTIGCGIERAPPYSAMALGVADLWGSFIFFFTLNGVKLRPAGPDTLHITHKDKRSVRGLATRAVDPRGSLRASLQLQRATLVLGGGHPAVAATGPCTLQMNFGLTPFAWQGASGQASTVPAAASAGVGTGAGAGAGAGAAP